MKQKLIDVIKPLIIPYLFCVSLCLSVLEIYAIGGMSVYTLISVMLSILIFAVLEFVCHYRLIGSLVYGLLLYACGRFLTSGLIAYSGFYEWFFSGGDSYSEDQYALVTAILFCVFFCSVGFYFTAVLYRFSYTTFICLIPCVLYVKVRDNISSGFLILILALNITLFILNRVKQRENGAAIFNAKVRYAGVALLATVVLAVSSLIPRPDETKYYDKFQELFLTERATYSVSNRFTRYSGNADYYRYLNDSLLYEVYTDEIMYMRRQWYDYYDNAQHAWVCENFDDVMSLSAYEKSQKLLSYDKLLDAYRKAQSFDGGFASENGIEKLLSYEGEDFDTLKILSVSPQNSGLIYFLTAIRLADMSVDEPQNVVLIENGGLFQRYGDMTEYSVSYYEEVYSAAKWKAAGGADISSSDYLALLYDAQEILEENGADEQLDVINAYIDDYLSAQQITADFEISSEIQQLAFEITEGLQYDYEKAAALQQYFRESGYRYDLDYSAPDKSVEYFIFESKTGTCSDFATAYALMAKSVGLTVRYVEGFVTEPIPGVNGMHEIRAQDAHAFPEVYIPGMGWEIYEPTMVVYRDAVQQPDEQNNGVLDNISIDLRILRAALIVALIVILAVIAVVISPFIYERLFILRIKLSCSNKSIVLIYNRIKQKVSNDKSKELTPAEVLERCIAKGVDITSTVVCFEKVCYGRYNAADSEKKNAIEQYRLFKMRKKK